MTKAINESTHPVRKRLFSYTPFKYRPVEKVVKRTLKLMRPCRRIVEIPTLNSCGFIISEDVNASEDVPPFDTSHFDGYAVNSEDLALASRTNPVRLKVVGKSNVEESYKGALGRMEAVYTATGAKIVDGADAVIPIERVRADEEHIAVTLPIRPGDNITPKGSDIKCGEGLLKANRIIRPRDAMALLNLGVKTVKVYDRLSVAILSIGDELTSEPNSAPPKRFETHSILLSKLVEGTGVPYNSGIVKDDADLIAKKVEALLDNFDIVVTIGGTSIGIRDMTYHALSKLKPFKTIARGIKIQPGRVTSVAFAKGKPVIMLPGHVQSMVVGALFVLLPLINGVSHLLPRHHLTVRAVLSGGIHVGEWKPFKRVRFVKLKLGEKGYMAKHVVGDSSMMSVLLRSDGFIVIPEGRESVEKGEEVEVYLLPASMPCF